MTARKPLIDKHFKIGRRISCRIGLDFHELWYKTLKNGNRQYVILGLGFEQDAHDPSLKIYSLTFLSLVVGIGWV